MLLPMNLFVHILYCADGDDPLLGSLSVIDPLLGPARS